MVRIGFQRLDWHWKMNYGTGMSIRTDGKGKQEIIPSKKIKNEKEEWKIGKKNADGKIEINFDIISKKKSDRNINIRKVGTWNIKSLIRKENELTERKGEVVAQLSSRCWIYRNAIQTLVDR